MEAFVRTHHVIALVAALAIGIGAKQYLIPTIEASQFKVAQRNLGVAITSPDKGSADRMEIASVKTPLQPIPDANGVALADYQPLMATGLYLNGPPRRFSAKEIMRNIEIPGF